MIKYKVKILKIPVGKNNDYSFLNYYPLLKISVYDETINAIRHGLQTKKKEVILYNIDNSEFSINIKKENWGKHLNKTLEHYVELEDWTRCIEIRDLIKEI